jgi:hypothetical protein
MTYLVRLHIFSGRPDPVWQISDNEAAKVFEAHKMSSAQLFEAKSPAATAAQRASGRLGYRGFSIVETNRPHPQGRLLSLRERAAPRGRTAFIRGQADAERVLLQSGEKLLRPRLLEAVSKAIPVPPPGGMVQTSCPACHGAGAPAYEPASWNNDPTRLEENNCYNYANNQATNTFAQPGRASGHEYTADDCANVGAAAGLDGLNSVANFSQDIPGWYVALVIWPGEDYHWYRQDNNGCWSHKMGEDPVINVDNAGHTITDPQTCDRGDYTVFCTYMTTTSNVHID